MSTAGGTVEEGKFQAGQQFMTPECHLHLTTTGGRRWKTGLNASFALRLLCDLEKAIICLCLDLALGKAYTR